jgi:dolichol-phosphate mannosyltransferase
MTPPKLSVVVPSRNEEESLPATVKELREVLDREAIPYEIIVVDDGSTDRTAAEVAKLCAGDPRIRSVKRRAPAGFGRAVRAGLAAVQGDVVIIYMADCSDSPADAVRYYRKLEEGYDCVFGSRFIKGSRVEGYPLLKLIINRIVNKCIQWLFWCPFNDLTNAFKAYRTEVIEECGPFRASHFNITIEMSLGALVRRYQIAEIPIDWKGRVAGVSKLRLLDMGRRYGSTLLKVMVERFLIADDVIADRLAARSEREDCFGRVGHRFCALEERLALAEQKIRALEERARNDESKMTKE